MNRDPHSIYLVENSLHGHREDQLAAFRDALQESGHTVAVASRLSPGLAWSRAPLLFPTADGAFLTFLTVSFLRDLLGRVTIGIFHRPKACWTGTRAKDVVKRWLTMAVVRRPRCYLLSVQPHALEPCLAYLTNGDIPNTALWYAPRHIGSIPDEEYGLIARFTAWKSGRRCVGFMGVIVAEKGLADFLALVERAKARADLCFLLCGKLPEELRCRLDAQSLPPNLFVADVYFTSPGFEALAAQVDVFWAFYARDYDQNSGIFGTAFRLARPVLVRQGSFLERLATHLEAASIIVPTADQLLPAISQDFIAPQSASSPESAVAREQRRFREVLEGILRRSSEAS